MSWTAACLFAAAALALGRALQVSNGFFNRIAFYWLLTSLAIAAAGVLAARMRTLVDSFAQRVLVPMLFLGVLIQCVQLLLARPLMYAPIARGFQSRTLTVSIAALAALALGVVATRGRTRAAVFAALVAVHTNLGVWVLRTVPDPRIDVVTVQREAIAAIESGRSPYSITFPDIYGSGSRFYAEGLTADGRVQFGLPYPPLTLAFAAPAQWVFGDFRYAQVIALAIAAVLIASFGWTRHAMLSAAVLLTTPRVLFELEQGWTEPYAVMLVALTTALLWRSSRHSPAAWGLMVSIKQYLAAALILIPLVPALPGMTRREIFIRTAAFAAAVTVPFVLWDPEGFFRSVVWLQVREPFRTDSLSVLAWLARRGIAVPTIATTVAAAIAAAALTLWKLPPSAGGLAAATAFVMFVLFAFGKKAFCNYYFFVLGALAVAIAATGERGPATEPTRASPAP